MEDNGDQK